MFIKELKLRNFRNYSTFSYSFENKVYMIFGKNAQGKTNLIEAISYLSTARSHRSKDENLIMHGKQSASIQGHFSKTRGYVDLKAVIHERGKYLEVNKSSVKKVSEFIGQFPCVLFSPIDLNLFSSSPKERRKFMDMELSKLSKRYVSDLNQYQILLKQRNLSLKRAKVNIDYLEILSEQMIDLQISIMKLRSSFLKQLLHMSLKFYKDISKGDTQLSIEYKSCIQLDEVEVMKEMFRKKYKENLNRDMLTKQTNLGIHKEDFVCYIDGNMIEAFASQGQKRSVILSLKIGLVYMIKDVLHEYPVVLLDDVFSELDDERCRILFDSLPLDVQVFITTIQEIPSQTIQREVKKIVIENGALKEEH